MRRVGLFLVMSLLQATPASASVRELLRPAPSPALRAVADRVEEQVVQIHSRATLAVRNALGELEPRTASLAGAGVLIGNGLALASLHVALLAGADGALAQVDQIAIAVPNHGIYQAALLGGDLEMDVGLFQLLGAPDMEGAALAPGDPALGDTVVALGSARDYTTAVGSAVTSVQISGGLAVRFLLAAPLGSVFWGGPVFDSDGELCGLLSPAADGSIAAVPVSLLRRVIEMAAGPQPASL
jgi:hypothetical protein